jgi:uncharacterized protein (DUF1684 family)
MPNLDLLRASKDEFFEHHPESPLTPEQQRDFTGLNYFPHNDALLFELVIHEFEEQATIQIQTSTGEVQPFIRYGQIHFDVGGQETTLTLYTNQHGYFLPFVDALAGKETYGAGRYIDPEKLPNGKLLVDFNLAYNPYCAYNEQWSCPLTPFENRLNVPIQAGEKNFN